MRTKSRFGRVFAVMVLLASGLAVPQSAVTAAPAVRVETKPVGDTAAAQSALRRLLPDHYRQFTFSVSTGPSADPGDQFRIAGRDGRIQVWGTTPAVMLTGANWYLKYVANATITWNGEQLNLPAVLPGPDQPIVQRANVAHRFALNDTDDGYTGAYRDWADWERKIDLLALQGVNEVLVTPGHEAVYYDTFAEFGYSDTELRNWIPQPAHQPWWLLQNMCCFPGVVSEQLIERRAQLGRKIADRLRELGMTPVFPGFYGTVPPNFTEKNPGGRTLPQGLWSNHQRSDWLDPRTTQFEEVAAAFYRHQSQRLGTTSMVKMDLLHEGGDPGDVPPGEAAKAVQTALLRAYPDATWAILGWRENPTQEMLAAIDTSKMLVVDGLSERQDQAKRESVWPNTPYAFGTIWNFGGRTTMGAKLELWNTRYWEWKAASESTLSGIALMPESSDNNPVAAEFFNELAWRTGPVDTASWFDQWAQRRYGGADSHAAAAWRVLRSTAYAIPADNSNGVHDGLFAAKPDLAAIRAAPFAPPVDKYDVVVFEQALTELLAVAPELRRSTAYRYDLADVARQALSNRSRSFLPEIKAAYDAGDQQRFGELTQRWLRWIALLEELMATDEQTMVGPLLAKARSWGGTTAEADQLEYDARSLFTTWSHRAGSEELNDYGSREWSGLIGGYYHGRWTAYFDELTSALVQGREPAAIDWLTVGQDWAQSHNTLPTAASGDVHQIAGKVRDELQASPRLPRPAADGATG